MQVSLGCSRIPDRKAEEQSGERGEEQQPVTRERVVSNIIPASTSSADRPARRGREYTPTCKTWARTNGNKVAAISITSLFGMTHLGELVFSRVFSYNAD